jgi:hypothetical protein
MVAATAIARGIALGRWPSAGQVVATGTPAPDR